MQVTETGRWRFKGPEMEGPIARWYAHVRGSTSQLEAYRKQAFQLTADLPDGATVLEVAPGPGYLAIEDMSRDATHADIEHEVNAMDLGRLSTFTTKATLEMLKRRAYAPAHFQGLAATSPFKTCQIGTEGIGLEVRLKKEIQR